MTYKQIVVWFQNRRAKQRSDERKLYFSARQSPAATGNHYSQRAVQPLQHNASVTGAPQQYPTASAAMNLVQMATPDGRTHVLTTSFASQEPVHFQPAATGFQATACSPQQRDPSGMKTRMQQRFCIGHSSPTGGSPYLPSPGSKTPSPPSSRTGRSLPPSPPNGLAPSKAMVLPPPPQGGAAVGSDLLRFSLASSHFQSHIPLKPPTPPLSHKGEPSHPVPATLS